MEVRVRNAQGVLHTLRLPQHVLDSLVTSTMGAAVVHDDDDDGDTEGGSDEDDGSDG